MSEPENGFVDQLKNSPHIRFSMKPTDFADHRTASLSTLNSLVEAASVRMRGWDFPHISRENTENIVGNNFVGSWNSAFGVREYWKMFQSYQFIHLYDKREFVETSGWRSHYGVADPLQRFEMDGERPAGFIDFVNSIWEIAERIEFSSRLAGSAENVPGWTLSYELNNTNRFALLSEPSRPLRGIYMCNVDQVHWQTKIESSKVIANSKNLAVQCSQHLLERFGLFEVEDSVISSIIDKLFDIKGW